MATCERAWEQEGGRRRGKGRLWEVAQVIPAAVALAIGVAFGDLAALAQVSVAHFVG